LATDPFLCLPLAQATLSPWPAALLIGLGLVLALLAGFASWAALAGRLTRAIHRPDSRRAIAGAMTAALLSAGLLFGGLLLQIGRPETYFQWSQSTENPVPSSVFLWLQLTIIGNALWPPLLSLAVGMLLGANQGHRRSTGAAPLRTWLMVGHAFAFWWPRRHEEHVPAATGEPEDAPMNYELTLASGEEVEAEEREYIENILEFGETTARDVMRPRPDVVAVDAAWPAARVLETVTAARYSRFPVYEDSVDNVIGILHLRDLLEFLARGEPHERLRLREMLMEPYFVPETKKADDILRELQRQKSHMAIVLDEYGGTAGILTIEDLLEEIVGEIQDEYDDEARLYYQREDGAWMVDAQLGLDELNELLGTAFASDEVDTLGGFVLHTLGRVPDGQETLYFGEDFRPLEAEQLDLAKTRLTVLSVERNRVGQVLVEIL
jgi:Mg2+/Co2+ transporter CorC